MSHFRRRNFLIDSQVQGALMFRVAAYWLYCLFTISLLLVWWDLFAGPPRRFLMVVDDVYRRFAPAAAASILIVLMDLLRLSNRFAGPARRLQNCLCDLADGKEVPPLTFRDNDFWQKMAADFNRVNDRMRQLAGTPAQSSAAALDYETAVQEEPALAGQSE